MRGNYKPLKGSNLTVVKGMHQFDHVYLVGRTTSEGRAEVSRGGGVGDSHRFMHNTFRGQSSWSYRVWSFVQTFCKTLFFFLVPQT